MRGLEALIIEQEQREEKKEKHIVSNILLAGLDFLGGFMVAVRLLFFVLIVVILLDNLLNYFQ